MLAEVHQSWADEFRKGAAADLTWTEPFSVKLAGKSNRWLPRMLMRYQLVMFPEHGGGFGRRSRSSAVKTAELLAKVPLVHRSDAQPRASTESYAEGESRTTAYHQTDGYAHPDADGEKDTQMLV